VQTPEYKVCAVRAETVSTAVRHQS
jgi:hypothetical protein